MNLSILEEIHAWWTRNNGQPNYYVQYFDGQRSFPMPFGNAVDYANLFGGEVKKVQW